MSQMKAAIVPLVLGVSLIGLAVYENHTSYGSKSVVQLNEETTNAEIFSKSVTAGELVQEYAKDHQIDYIEARKAFPEDLPATSQEKRISYKIYERLIYTNKLSSHPSVKLYAKLVDGQIDTIYKADVKSKDYGFSGQVFTNIENPRKVYFIAQGNFYKDQITQKAVPTTTDKQAKTFQFSLKTTYAHNANQQHDASLYLDGYIEE